MRWEVIIIDPKVGKLALEDFETEAEAEEVARQVREEGWKEVIVKQLEEESWISE